MSEILYQPSQKEMNQSRLGVFTAFVQNKTGVNFGEAGPKSYQKLHQWSVKNLETFHDLVWSFCGVLGDKGSKITQGSDGILGTSFFPDSKISFAENMLGRVKTHPHDPAIISRTAGAKEDRILTWQQLYDQVSLWSQALEKLGIVEGDRVATYLPHGPEAYILMMAVANRGAIFSSVGTEMGAQATAARFVQIQPKTLIAVDGYTHMAREGQPGKKEDRMCLIAQLQDEVKSLERTVVIANLQNAPNLSKLNADSVLATDLLKDVQSGNIDFVRRDFNQPLAILFSSGSTGQPKCFVHGVGGTLLKHAIEHQLQSDIRPGDRIFFHSTTSWMMFNWLASGLANDATIMIYDGNPAYPGADAQLQFAADYGCSHLGTAAAIIQDVWMKNDVRGTGLDLSSLRLLKYTGSVLSDEGFRYVNSSIKADMGIDGVCGGTDFVGYYACGNPFTPTVAGHLKGPALGMDVDVWSEEGGPCEEGKTGELVIKSSFPSRPLYFWNDEDGTRFRGEYFEHFDCDPTVWRHGDAVKKMPDGLVVEGRSDTTLNQGGVRIGTQQLYDALGHPELKGRVQDVLAASFKDSKGGDHTALFLVAENATEDFIKRVKAIISDSVGRLCCPHEIIVVPYVLKTPNGKRAEKPTAQALGSKDIKSPETYGEDDLGVLKVNLFVRIGQELRQKPSYGFVDAA